MPVRRRCDFGRLPAFDWLPGNIHKKIWEGSLKYQTVHGSDGWWIFELIIPDRLSFLLSQWVAANFRIDNLSGLLLGLLQSGIRLASWSINWFIFDLLLRSISEWFSFANLQIFLNNFSSCFLRNIWYITFLLPFQFRHLLHLIWSYCPREGMTFLFKNKVFFNSDFLFKNFLTLPDWSTSVKSPTRFGDDEAHWRLVLFSRW